MGHPMDACNYIIMRPNRIKVSRRFYSDTKYIKDEMCALKYIDGGIDDEYIKELGRQFDEKNYLFLDVGNKYMEFEKKESKKEGEKPVFYFRTYPKSVSCINHCEKGRIVGASSFFEFFNKFATCHFISMKPKVIPEEKVNDYLLEHPILATRDVYFEYIDYSFEEKPEEKKPQTLAEYLGVKVDKRTNDISIDR